MSDYTPSTGVVRSAWASLATDEQPDVEYDAAKAEFDRWLAEVKAEAWDEGWSAQAEQSFDMDGKPLPPVIPNPYRT